MSLPARGKPEAGLALEAEELAWVEEEAARRGVSSSVLVTAAVRLLRRAQDACAARDLAWHEYLEWYAEEHGPLAQADMDAAERELFGSDDGPTALSAK